MEILFGLAILLLGVAIGYVLGGEEYRTKYLAERSDRILAEVRLNGMKKAAGMKMEGHQE